MSASRPGFATELLTRCGDRGFTPGVKDVEPLLAAWQAVRDAPKDSAGGLDPREIGKRVVKALSRGDRGVGEALCTSLRDATAGQRAMRLRAVTRIGQRVVVAGLSDILLAALTDSDPKVVREAARAVAKRNDGNVVAHVEALLEIAHGGATPERRAAVDALGRLAGPELAPTLRTLLPSGDDDLDRRLSEATTMIERRSGRAEPGGVVLDQPLPGPQTLSFQCRRGVGWAVVEQIKRLHGADDCAPVLGRTTDGEVVTDTWGGALGPLYGVRCAIDIGLSFALVGGGDLAARIIETLSGSSLVEALQAWTQGPVRFRLAVAGGGSRRGLVWQVARALAASDSPLVNDSRDVAWSIEVDPDAGRVVCRPKGVDPRFVYRQYDVPAASHPTLAALLAWVAAPQPGDVVWDPFCGSASELVECGLRTTGLVLVGSDRVEDAVRAARANLSAAGLDGPLTSVHQCDALSSSMPGIDAVSVIITNPPMGHRVSDKDAVPVLLAGIVERAAKVLAPGGRLVWLSPLAEQTGHLARTLGLDVTDRGIVDLGGLSATLQILRKPERSA